MEGWLSIINILPIPLGVICVGLGIAVLAAGDRPSFRARITFAVFACSMGIWQMGLGTFLLTDNDSSATVIAVIYYIAGLAIVWAFLVFAIELMRMLLRVKDRILSITLLSIPVALAGLAIALYPPVLFIAVDSKTHTVALQPITYGIYTALFCFYGISALITLLIANIRVKQNATQSRIALRSIIWVMSITLPAGFFFDILLPLFGNYSLIAVGPLFTMPIVATVYYAIRKTQIFNLKDAAVEALAYMFSAAIVACVYIAINLAASFVLYGYTNAQFDNVSLIGIVAATIAALVFWPIKRLIDKATAAVFYDTFTVENFFETLNRKFVSTNDFSVLLRDVVQYIGIALNVTKVSLIVSREDGADIITQKTERHISTRELKVLDEHAFIGRSPEAIVSRELVGNEIERSIGYKDVMVILVLRGSDNTKPVGYLLLGERRRGVYSHHDTKIFQALANELLVAIQYATATQQVHNLNATLQQRIDEATRELRESNAKLQRLDKAKDEFVSMASHQLRTPLTSVKGYVSMVLEGDAGKISPTQAKLLGEAYASSERMVHLIGDFLNVSRLQTGKFMLESRPIDLSKLVAREVKSLQPAAHLRGLQLRYRKPSYFPLLNLDEGKIQQVVMNFIDNAIYYSHDNGTITVTLEKADGMVELRVRDDGIGVPKAEQEHLFSKFFRAENARKQRPDGTGVGLFLAKKVIDAHSGSIIFESQEGKGSTFGFRLPIKKLAAGGDTDNLRNQDDQQDNHTDSD